VFRLFLWILTLLSTIVAGFFLIDSVFGERNAIQQGSEAAVAVGFAVIPFVFSRAADQIVSEAETLRHNLGRVKAPGGIAAIGVLALVGIAIVFKASSTSRAILGSTPTTEIECSMTSEQRAVVDSLSPTNRKAFGYMTCREQDELEKLLRPLSENDRNLQFNQLFSDASAAVSAQSYGR